MGKKQHKTGRSASVPAGLALGAAVGLGVVLTGTGVLAVLLDAEKIAWENIGYGIMISLLLGAFVAAWFACWRIKRQYILVSIMSGVTFLGLLMCITALFFGGKYEAVGVTSLLVAGGSGACGMLLVYSHNRRSGKIRKYTYR